MTLRTHFSKTVVIAMTTAGTIVLGACGGSSSAADGSVMKVGITQGVPGDLMAVIAESEGLFDQRGVDVELMPPSLTTAQSAAVISNDLTVGTMVPGTMWPAIDKGACVKALGSTLGNTLEVIMRPGTQITGDTTDPNTTMQNLEGKTIGVTSRGSGMELWITEMLNQAGMDPATDVTFVAVGAPATAIQAFKAGQIDAMYYGPTMEEQLPPSEVTRVTDIVGRDGNALSPLVQGYPTATCETIENRPNDVLNYCKAMWDAYDFSQDPKNAATVAQLLAGLVGVSPAAAPALWESVQNAYLPPAITETSWKEQAPFAGSPTPEVPDYAGAVYEPCAGGDPR
ncbi:ABC transporter substrate-binding protein [Nocardia cyriacigeorgica]|uniref:ABC transporter substrate-binding protein n=2 Tax=Nocardia cyriacigeorgica TaxID=135487 RepID=A0A6P1D442_9NOCA|nr:ABC transporter substrate-binding protein [Nocardia cyriacigeorgica]NEW44221.1 ABC transporter substrate-binding protein [Nocardia cyriacigeorgica]NEW51282.1 ABC transporter substrate-binding protein [Nocardia cyriacigeorgica]NEW56951.1 ABC transporter substrate-binding protein [Nocardia cyriacigeorgica]